MSSAAVRDFLKLMSGSVAAKAFGVVALMLFTRVLSKEQLSVFPVFLMLAAIPSLVLTFGIFSAFIRDVPSLIRTDADRARSLVVTASGVIVAATIVPSLAAWHWSGAIAVFAFKDAAQAWMIRIMVPGFVAFMVSRIADHVMWGRGQYGATSLVQILELVVRPAATIACYLVLGYPGVVIGLVAAQCVMAGIAISYIRDIFLGPLPRLYPLRKLFSDSLPYYAGNYLSYFRGDGDSLLVTTFLGPVALAEYYVAKTLYGNLALVLTAVDRIAAERLARAARTAEFAGKVKTLHVRISQTLIPFALLAMAVAPGALIVLAGARYADATWPAILLLVFLLVQYVAVPIDRAVYVALPALVRLAYTAVEAVAVLATMAILAPLAGLIGVAAARVLAPLGVILFGLTILRRHLGVRLPFRATFLALATAVPGTIAALVIVPPADGVAGAFAAIAMAAVVWSASFLALTWLLNRPLLATWQADATRQYRAVFSK